MNRNQVVLSLVLGASEVPISVRDFFARLTVQKAVYLLQEAGIQMGYPYSWYVRGPYSSRLAEDLFYLADLEKEEADELKAYTLGEKTRAIVEGVKTLVAPQIDAVARAKHLELIASVLFLIRTGQAKPAEHAKLSAVLKANGKAFEPDDAEKAVASLRRYGYAL